MTLYAVTKSPVDLEGTVEFIGVFSTRARAIAGCTGAGTYTIAHMQLDRIYRGDLLDVEIHRVVGDLEVN